MAIDLTLKSTSVTNLNATPVVANAAGAGAQGVLREIGDYKTVTAALSITSIIRLVRVPTNVKVKSVIFQSEAQGAGKFDLGVYYSDSTTDGTPAGVRGTVVDADFFASALETATAVAPTEVVAESGVYTLDERNLPLWQAAGLSADPGGYFDIAATVVTTDVTTGTGKLGISVRYVM